MNKQSNPITWALALAFVTLASIQIAAGPRVTLPGACAPLKSKIGRAHV